MKKVGGVLGSVLLSWSAFGAVTLTKVNSFSNTSKFQNDPVIQQLKGVVLPIETELSKEVCGATFLSGNYILTALHCLDGEITEKTNLGGTTIYKTDFALVKKRKPFRLKVGVWNGSPSTNLVRMAVRGVAAGKGYYLKLDHGAVINKELDAYKKLIEEGFGPGEDWVILQLGAYGKNCVPLRLQTVAVGEEVSALGYWGRQSSGRRVLDGSQYFTRGNITAGIQENESFKNWLSKNPNLSLGFVDNLIRGLSHPGTFYATIDDVPGNSGTGVLDINGALVGMINSMALFDKKDRDTYISGSTISVSAQQILTGIKDQATETEFREIMNCSLTAGSKGH